FLPATRASGPHPFPFRTRSLSPTAPMVLRSRDRGRVGRRRRLSSKGPSHFCATDLLTSLGHLHASSECTPPAAGPASCISIGPCDRTLLSDLPSLRLLSPGPSSRSNTVD